MPVILFDGVCNLCNGTVQFILTHDPRGRFQFASLQSDAAKRILGGVPVSRLVPDDPSVANLLLLAATETATDDGMSALIAGLKEVL